MIRIVWVLIKVTDLFRRQLKLMNEEDRLYLSSWKVPSHQIRIHTNVKQHVFCN